MVRRLFVEKKSGFDVEAQGLFEGYWERGFGILMVLDSIANWRHMYNRSKRYPTHRKAHRRSHCH